MTDWHLNRRERKQLQALLSQTRDPRVLQRAYTLLWLDDGDTVAAIAAHWQVSCKSVYNWRHRYVERQSLPLEQRLSDGERSGRPCTAQGVIESFLDAVLDTAPESFGYRATVWTAPLLVRYLAEFAHILVSVQSVRLALARLRLRWKRARHQLALRPATWRQAKGG